MPRPSGFFRRPAIGFAWLLAAFATWAAGDWYISHPSDAIRKAHYVGRKSCVECHQPEAAAWTGSHHDRAMELATDETVFGDFNDVEFTHFDERTRFFRDGERFMVNAEGPDGEYHDYEVKYTFGVHPLQQYMVKFPDGRIQVLRVSWDVEQKKWFYVAPMDMQGERIEAGDPFHWTGFTQNWNTMCAECHVTDYHKNYDLAKDTYDSKFKEIDVSCETCHGPGSVHVGLAEGRSLFWDRHVGYGLTNTLKNVSNERQVNTCAPCHSRRSTVHPDYRAGDAYLDYYAPSLLERGLYHTDGQILDEVFELGSFTQSRMYREGVKCTDCHDAHSLELKYEGNRLCAQCHQPGKYDGPGHHRHVSAAAGAPETQCVTCHMPTTTYMGIDQRRDHSIRVPRPDLTVELGTPNVCNRCHTKPDEDARWAAAAVVKWYGNKRPDDPHYARAIHAAQRTEPGGEDLIRRLLRRKETPQIVRATLIELLGAYPTEQSVTLRRDALSDPDPLVRTAAVRAYAATSAEALIRDLGPKLSDSVRTVRMAAVGQLAELRKEPAFAEFRDALKQAVADYQTGTSSHLDRAETHRNLGSLALKLGKPVDAVKSFRTAIRLQPYRTEFRTELSQTLARLAADPEQAAAWKDVGGSEEEIRRLREDEVELLERDSKLLPNNAEPHFHRGQLLYLLGRTDEAREAFAEACRLAPNGYEYWMWLAMICERQARWDEAREAVLRMAELRPDASEWKDLYQNILRQRSEQPASTETKSSPPAVDSAPGDKLSEESSKSVPERSDTPGQKRPQADAAKIGSP